MRNLYLFVTALAAILASTGVQAATPFTYNTTCLSDSVRFTIAEADQAGIDSVKWYFGDPASGRYDSSTNMEGVHAYNTLGTYTVTLMAYRAGVPDVSTTAITIVAPVPYDFGPQDQTLCEGGSMTLTAPLVPGAAYEWQDGSTGQSIIADTSATYKVKINGCLVPDSVNLFFTPIPEIDLGEDVILCTGETLQLDATAQNCTFLWSTGATTPDIIVHSDVPTATVNYSVVVDAKGCGTYTDDINITFAGTEHPFSLGPDTLLCPGESVRITADTEGAMAWRWSTGARGPSINVSSPADIWVFVNIDNVCNVLDTIRVRYNALRNIDLGGDTIICKGERLVLTADFGTGTYLWQDGSKQATFYVRETGYYYVRAQIGRCVSSDTIHVRYEDTLHVNLGPDTVLCRNEIFLLYPAGAGRQYKWQDSTTVPIYRVTQPGIYALVSNNSCGRSVDSVTVRYQDCECQLYLPTAFSPNGDGINDYFRPHYRCTLAFYQLSIYDRWGERVFYSTDPQIAWTGKKQGAPVQSGTYVWILEYTSKFTGRHVKQNGTVTVIY